MTKHQKKKNIVKTPVSANPTLAEQVEINKQIITDKLSGSNIKRLNNLNWLRHEIAWTEPRILFHEPISKQAPFFDYSCTKGIEAAYDYITDKNHNTIDRRSICDIHYLIAKETNMQPCAGLFRQNTAILEIFVNGQRIYTPNPAKIQSLLENALYEWENGTKPDPMRAFDLHFNLIMVHPFEDYNKRTSRMVMNWALIQSGYRPIAFIRKSDKENYRKALANMAQGDSKSYYKYMYGAMVNSQNNLINQLNASKIR